MDGHFIVLSLTGILVLAVAAQWVAWRTKLPAILILLLLGFLVGPGLRWLRGPETLFLDPDKLLGDLLLPLVSLAVCVILYEGGLTLRIAEIKKVGKVVRSLVTVAMAVTWLLSALLAHWLLGFDVKQSLLLGAILVVTGPTVVGPLLRQVRPRGAVGAVLKWEGIVIDPIGALLAVLVYEAIHVHGSAGLIVWSILKTAVVGGLLGYVGARLLVFLIQRHLLPSTLDNAASLALVIGVFTLSNQIQHESGLLAATVMGIVLANQTVIPVRHMVEFKENLRVLLISTLFIVLAAKLRGHHLLELTRPGAIEFLVLLIILVRPASVFLATARSNLTWRERTYIAFLAPRGIVAAAVASSLALTLAQGAMPAAEAERLVALTFMVIIGTVSFYGLAAGPLAHKLGLADRAPQGLLIVGAHPLARELGVAMQAEGLRVLLLDVNPENIATAWEAGLEAQHVDALDDHAIEELDLGGLGRLLSLTPNDEVNELACERFLEVFSRQTVYRFAPRRKGMQARSRILFGSDESLPRLYERRSLGAEFARVELTADWTYADQRKTYGEHSVPMFVITNGKVQVFTVDRQPTPQEGDVLISFTRPILRPLKVSRAAVRSEIDKLAKQKAEEAAPAAANTDGAPAEPEAAPAEGSTPRAPAAEPDPATTPAASSPEESV